jgi:hypothetical protein
MRFAELKKFYKQMQENSKSFDKSNPDQASAMLQAKLEFEYQEQIRSLERKLKTAQKDLKSYKN